MILNFSKSQKYLEEKDYTALHELERMRKRIKFRTQKQESINKEIRREILDMWESLTVEERLMQRKNAGPKLNIMKKNKEKKY